jgi:hypothetical protein
MNSEPLNQWVNESMNHNSCNESTNQRSNERTNEWMDEWDTLKQKKIVTVRPRWFYTDCLWELADPGVASCTRSGPCAKFFSASKSKPYLCIIYMYMYIICLKRNNIYIYVYYSIYIEREATITYKYTWCFFVDGVTAPIRLCPYMESYKEGLSRPIPCIRSPAIHRLLQGTYCKFSKPWCFADLWNQHGGRW